MLALIDGHQNPFFLQKRVGLHCREFTIYKLRTMKSCRGSGAPVHYKPGAPELTRISQFLRLGIDELPQLINIIKGDMSLIGPRPHALEYAKHYASVHPHYYERCQVRPGLACIVEVTALHYMTEQAKHVKMRVGCDLYYVKHQSFLLDLRIFYKMTKYVLSSLFGYLKRKRHSLAHSLSEKLHLAKYAHGVVKEEAVARRVPLAARKHRFY